MLAGFTGAPAFAAEPPTPAVTPKNDLDNWDDDVWADWGAQPGSAKTDEKAGIESKTSDANGPGSTTTTDSNASSGYGGNASGNNGFAESSDKIRFRLVREGENDELNGVRKYRPQYGKRRKL